MISVMMGAKNTHEAAAMVAVALKNNKTKIDGHACFWVQKRQNNQFVHGSSGILLPPPWKNPTINQEVVWVQPCMTHNVANNLPLPHGIATTAALPLRMPTTQTVALLQPPPPRTVVLVPLQTAATAWCKQH